MNHNHRNVNANIVNRSIWSVTTPVGLPILLAPIALYLRTKRVTLASYALLLVIDWSAVPSLDLEMLTWGVMSSDAIIMILTGVTTYPIDD